MARNNSKAQRPKAPGQRQLRVGEEILHLVRRGARERGRAVLFVSHDLGAVALVCDRIAVMDEGVIVESGPTGAVLNHPQHARTQALLEAVPTLP